MSNSTLINMLHCSRWLVTLIFGETEWGAFIYLSLTAWRFAITLGKIEAKPGI
jgi:hypothetical protein